MAMPVHSVAATSVSVGAMAVKDYGVDRETLVRAFRVMQMSRRIDDREILLKRQNRIWFQISGAGHECIQIAGGAAAEAGRGLVFSLLPRSRARPGAGHNAGDRCCSRASGAAARDVLRRTPDALALVRPGAAHLHRLVPQPARSSSRRWAAADGAPRSSIPARSDVDARDHRRRRHQRGRILGVDQRRPAWTSCRCSTSSRTMATRFRCRSSARPPAAASRAC